MNEAGWGLLFVLALISLAVVWPAFRKFLLVFGTLVGAALAFGYVLVQQEKQDVVRASEPQDKPNFNDVYCPRWDAVRGCRR